MTFRKTSEHFVQRFFFALPNHIHRTPFLDNLGSVVTCNSNQVYVGAHRDWRAVVCSVPRSKNIVTKIQLLSPAVENAYLEVFASPKLGQFEIIINLNFVKYKKE